MLELKPISSQGIPHAIAKAERYRLLNEPQEAESICRDILAIDSDNQEVLVMLLLAITDQFGKRAGVSVGDAQRVLGSVRGEYEKAYYGGVIFERWVKSRLRGGEHHGLSSGYFREAMDFFARAMKLARPDNEDAILRWNACVRFMEQHPEFKTDTEETISESGFHEGAPR
jgi:hypothetical protein